MVTVHTSLGTFTARDDVLAAEILAAVDRESHVDAFWASLSDDEYDAALATFGI